jgi:hypothetical protein
MKDKPRVSVIIGHTTMIVDVTSVYVRNIRPLVDGVNLGQSTLLVAATDGDPQIARALREIADELDGVKAR